MQYLIDNFGTVPHESEELRNGHVLFLYTDNGLQVARTAAVWEKIVSEES